MSENIKQKKSDYFVSMCIFQDDKFRQKEAFKRYTFFLFSIGSTILISETIKFFTFDTFIFNIINIISILLFLIGFMGTVLFPAIMNEELSMGSNSSKVASAITEDTISLIIEKLEKNRYILENLSQRKIDEIVSNIRYGMDRQAQFKSQSLRKKAEYVIFKIQEMAEKDLDKRMQNEIDFQKKELESLKEMQLNLESKIENDEKSLYEYKIMKKTKELNEIEVIAPSMILVD